MATKVVENLIHRWRGRNNFGYRGETLAAKELERRGYEILERRWRCRLGEIDLVARDGDTVVVVEVKTRARHGHFSPLDAVDARKQRKLIQLATAYLRARRLGDVTVRFDVAGVILAPGESPEVDLVRNAFEA